MSNKRYFEIVFPPGTFGILVICFILLKIFNQIDWPWIYILSPIIVGTLISLFCYVRNNGKTND